MAGEYATLADLKAHWPELPAEGEAEATQKLHEASVEIRGNYSDLDARILAETLDPDIPKLVVCRMVKRAMAAPDTQGVESSSFGAGPFSQGFKYTNPDGSVYLSAADKRLLAKPAPARKAFTIRVGV